MSGNQVVRLRHADDGVGRSRRSRLVRRVSAAAPFDTLTLNLTSEFLTTALFTAVTTSMVTARAQKRALRLQGSAATYLPRKPELFPLVAQRGSDEFLTDQLTGDLSQIYRQLDFVLSMTPTDDDGWLGPASDPLLWAPLSELWRPLAGTMRLLLLVMADRDGMHSTGQMARLLEIEALVKATRYGGTPCVRTDGVVLVPGWLDRRSDRRIPVGVSVRLDCGRGLQRVVLNDVSVTGAGLSGAPSLSAGTRVSVELPNGRLLSGRAIWSHASSVGVRFLEPLEETDPLFADILNLRRVARNGDGD